MRQNRRKRPLFCFPRGFFFWQNVKNKNRSKKEYFSCYILPFLKFFWHKNDFLATKTRGRGGRYVWARDKRERMRKSERGKAGKFTLPSTFSLGLWVWIYYVPVCVFVCCVCPRGGECTTHKRICLFVCCVFCGGGHEPFMFLIFSHSTLVERPLRLICAHTHNLTRFLWTISVVRWWIVHEIFVHFVRKFLWFWFLAKTLREKLVF